MWYVTLCHCFGEGIKSLVSLDKQEEQQQEEYSSIRGCDRVITVILYRNNTVFYYRASIVTDSTVFYFTASKVTNYRNSILL